MVIFTSPSQKYRIRTDTGKVYFTYSDLQELPEWPEESMLELTAGELYVVPSPTPKHQEISAELEFIIRSYLKQYPIGMLYYAPIDVVFSEEDVVIPDLCFVSQARTNIIKETHIQDTPDFIIEILSTNKNRDLLIKKEMYEKYHVKEYWIVDPKEKTILVYIYQPTGNFGKSRIYTLHDTILCNSIPNLIISLKDIFK